MWKMIFRDFIDVNVRCDDIGGTVTESTSNSYKKAQINVFKEQRCNLFLDKQNDKSRKV